MKLAQYGDGVRVTEDYYNGTTTVTSIYFMGGFYEVTDPSGANTITRYYSLGGMKAKYDGTPTLNTCSLTSKAQPWPF